MRDRKTIWQPEGKRHPPLPPARYPWRLTPRAIHAQLRLAPPCGPAQASDAALERAAARHPLVSVDPQGEQVHDLIIEAVNDEGLEFWIDRDGSLVDGEYINEPWHEDWRAVQACALVRVRTLVAYAYPVGERTAPWRLPADLAFCTVEPDLHGEKGLAYPDVALVMTRRGAGQPAAAIEALARKFLDTRTAGARIDVAAAARRIGAEVEADHREWRDLLRSLEQA